MKRKLLTVLLLVLCTGFLQAQKIKSYSISSPNGKIQIQVTAGDQLRWSVITEGDTVLLPSSVSMTLSGGKTWGRQMHGIKAITRTINNQIIPLHYKKDSVSDHCQELSLSTRDGYSIVFRAYDDGAAYHFVGQTAAEVEVQSEEAMFRFPSDYSGYFPFVNDPHNHDVFETSFENTYNHIRMSEFSHTDTLAFAPVLLDLPKGRKAAITEADLEDYPGMFLQGLKNGHGLQGRFAPYPLEEKQGGHNDLQSFVLKRADYLARTNGNRSFPWRILLISQEDKDLVNSDMVYRLASPCRLTETDWIKPGKVAWDWWNDWNISHVSFRAGINTETYKYYIDFASAHGIEYILLDEGWADSRDIMKIVPEINLPEIVRYAQSKGVGVWLWAGWLPLDQKMEEALNTYSAMGIKGFKVDFMDRDDQKMLQSYYRLAKQAAAHHIMLDFHGTSKPAGLQRTYPNVVNYEGVHGMEQEKWSNRNFPLYDVTIPFIRMLAGPLDYTPGAMRNANKDNFRPVWSMPMSQGTRCHQLAMYVVFEAPFEMLADNPTAYMREPESLGFISQVPTVFDETRALPCQVAEYVNLARRKGTDWYAGGMTNWTARDLQIDLSFLGSGNYEMELFQDGMNADRDATDYLKVTRQVQASDKLMLHLAPGGGWAARFRKIP